MARINLTRGLIRLWTVLTALWLACVGFLAWDEARRDTQGLWQATVEVLPGSKPWHAFDGTKKFEEVFSKPSAAKHPTSFSKLSSDIVKDFDDAVRKNEMTLVSFPDDSALYLYTAFESSERELVARWFWEGRWERRWKALLNMPWLVALALVPPLALLLLGGVSRWIVRGFRPA